MSNFSLLLFFKNYTILNFYSWLLTDKDMKVRSLYPGFTNAVSQYFDHLIPILSRYQVSLLFIYIFIHFNMELLTML